MYNPWEQACDLIKSNGGKDTSNPEKDSRVPLRDPRPMPGGGTMYNEGTVYHAPPHHISTDPAYKKIFRGSVVFDSKARQEFLDKMSKVWSGHGKKLKEFIEGAGKKAGQSSKIRAAVKEMDKVRAALERGAARGGHPSRLPDHPGH